MSKYKSYRDRVNANGNTLQDAVKNTTKRQTTDFILNSPSKRYVKLNNEIEDRPCIVSDKDSFNKRLFLFLPDSAINVGDYIHYDTFTYLATDRKRDEIYPELTGELCNEVYRIENIIKQVVGEDDFGRPIYDEIDGSEFLPCVITTTTSNAEDNNPIQLPIGTAIARIPYIEGMIPKINEEYKTQTAQYQVKNVSYEHVVNGIGYLEILLRREVDV